MGRLLAGAIFLFGFLSLPLVVRAADPYEALSVLRIEDTMAADFSLPTVDGKASRLSDFKGKVVLLGFFQTF